MRRPPDQSSAKNRPPMAKAHDAIMGLSCPPSAKAESRALVKQFESISLSETAIWIKERGEEFLR